MVSCIGAALLAISIAKSVANVYTDKAPIVDGKISEDCWRNATVITDFVQLMPQKGKPPTESTKVYLLYDNENLYFGIECFDDPNQIKADTRIRDSDKISWDDGIVIFISTDKNRMEGYVFQLNAIGTQKDIRLSEGGNCAFPEWDGEWLAKTALTNKGWEAEIVIPFRILKFNENEDIWGFDFERNISRKSEVIGWCDVSRQGRINEFGEMMGLDLEKIIKGNRAMDFKLSPYSSLFLKNQEKNLKLGVDAFRIDFSSEFKSEITLHPDYAHIEADIDEFNLDKLPQWLPEKRPFFMEGMTTFDTPITLLYTRSIGDILMGTKIIGKPVGVDIGFLGTILDTTTEEKAFVGRLKKSFSKYNLGIFSLCNLEPDNMVFDIDGSAFLPKQVYISGQVAKSWQEKTESDLLYYLCAERRVDKGINFRLRRRYIPQNFEDIRGYIYPMTDLVSTEASVSPKFQINKWIIKDLSFSGGYTYWRTTSYAPIKKGTSVGTGFTFVKNIFASCYFSKEERWDGVDQYDNVLWTLSASYLPGGLSQFNLNSTFGDYWGGKLFYPSLNFNYTFFGILNNTLNISYQIIEYPDTTEKELIAVLIPSINLKKNINLRAFLEWSDLSKILMTNFLLDWDIITRTKLYIALNRKAEIGSADVSPEWVFFIKLSTGIRF